MWLVMQRKRKLEFDLSQNSKMKNHRWKLCFMENFTKLSRQGSGLSRQGWALPSPAGGSATTRILSVFWERMICLWNSDEEIAIWLGNSSSCKTATDRENEEEVDRNESGIGHRKNAESRFRSTRTILYAYRERVIDHQWLKYSDAHENESLLKQTPNGRITFSILGIELEQVAAVRLSNLLLLFCDLRRRWGENWKIWLVEYSTGYRRM